MSPFNEHHDVKSSAKRMLIILCIFIPLYFYGIHVFLQSYSSTSFSNRIVFLCATIPALLGIGYSIVLLRSERQLRWIITSSHVIYESPNRILGDSFNLLISEVKAVSTIGSTDYAACVTTSGETQKFSIKYRGGRSFYTHLAKYYKGDLSNESQQHETQ